MATPRVLRFDAEGRPLEFFVWLLHAQRLLEIQVQADESLWAHASGDLRAPPDLEPLGADPTTKDRDRFARQHAALFAWKSRNAAACIALNSLLLGLRRPTSPRFARLVTTALPALTHSLHYSPPPMAITIYFIATSLPDRLASVCDTLLLKHPSELTIGVLERGGQGAGGSGGGVAGGSGGSAGAGGAPGVASSDSPTAAGGGDARQQQQPLLSQRPQQQQGPGPRQVSRGDTHPPCPYFVQTGTRSGLRCDRRHPPGQCFALLTDTLRAAYGVDGPAPDWLPFVCSHGAALWAMPASQLLDLLGTPHAMSVVVDSSASESVYLCVFSLGASVDLVLVASVGTCLGTSPGVAPEDASLSFTLDSGASHCFFRNHTTLTPLPAPVSVALADPKLGPVTTHYTTTLPCPAVPSGFMTGFQVPSFSRNLVGVRPLVGSHVGVWFEPSGDSANCADSDTYAPLATFHAEPGSGLYTLCQTYICYSLFRL
ncbi:unnamed protein product [Closterium sp. NIES-53]